MANVSIANNKRQFPKTLQPVKKSKGFLPALIPCRDVEQQSAFIASRILELRDEGVSLEDIGVLYRSHYHSLELQLELTRRNIPYRVQSGVRFFEQAHIKDVISYLRIIVNPRDELAWKRLLKMIPSVGNATANKIYESLAYAENPFALVKKEDFKYQPRSPPMYSAKKIEGKKLYELARKGIEIERKPVKVTIYNLEIIKNENQTANNSELETWNLKLKVACSAGTYIRTLAEDIGKKLEMGAHLAELRRTRAGKFDISKAVTLEELEKIVLENRLDEILISMNEAVSHLPEISLSEEEITKTRNGMKLKREDFDAKDGENVRMIDENENLLAVGNFSKAEKTIQPKIVLM